MVSWNNENLNFDRFVLNAFEFYKYSLDNATELIKLTQAR